MIKVVAKHFIKEEKLSDFIDIMRVLVRETKTNDAGCMSYEFYQDISNPRTVTMIEEWESQKAVSAHLQAKHFLEAIAQIGPVYERDSEINLYQKLF